MWSRLNLIDSWLWFFELSLIMLIHLTIFTYDHFIIGQHNRRQFFFSFCEKPQFYTIQWCITLYIVLDKLLSLFCEVFLALKLNFHMYSRYEIRNGFCRDVFALLIVVSPDRELQRQDLVFRFSGIERFTLCIKFITISCFSWDIFDNFILKYSYCNKRFFKFSIDWFKIYSPVNF